MEEFQSCGRPFWSHMAVALCAGVASMECLFAGWWCDLAFR